MDTMHKLLNNLEIEEKRKKLYADFEHSEKGKDIEFDKIYFLKKQNIIFRHIQEQEKAIKEKYVTMDEAEAGLEHIVVQTVDYLNKHAAKLQGLTYEFKHLDDGTDYNGFMAGGNRVLLGMRDYKNGYVYYGEWKHNCRNGWGVYENKAIGYKYAGNWKEDKKNGFGKELTITNYYEGNFLDDKKEGFGVIKEEGVRYDITWKNDKKHGHGKKIDSNGEETDVYFLNGVKSPKKSQENSKKGGDFLSRFLAKKG